jgi:hypothetical protein
MSAIINPYVFPTQIKVVTTDYAIGPEKVIFADPAAGNITLTLPPMAEAVNRIYYVKKTSLSSNLVIIDGNGSETIDGNPTATINTPNGCIALLTDGVDWKII